MISYLVRLLPEEGRRFWTSGLINPGVGSLIPIYIAFSTMHHRWMYAGEWYGFFVEAILRMTVPGIECFPLSPPSSSIGMLRQRRTI
jgi:hypothetical protein